MISHAFCAFVGPAAKYFLNMLNEVVLIILIPSWSALQFMVPGCPNGWINKPLSGRAGDCFVQAVLPAIGATNGPTWSFWGNT